MEHPIGLLTKAQADIARGMLGLTFRDPLPQAFLDLHDDAKRMRDKIGAARFTPTELLIFMALSGTMIRKPQEPVKKASK